MVMVKRTGPSDLAFDPGPNQTGKDRRSKAPSTEYLNHGQALKSMPRFLAKTPGMK
jgi:hypothetical protein